MYKGTLDEFRATLRRKGMPSAYVIRCVHEVGDHLEDLMTEALEKGLSREEASRYSAQVLGDTSQLAGQLAESMKRCTWWGRHRVIGFFFLPVALFSGIFLLFLICGALVGHLAGWWGTVGALNPTLRNSLTLLIFGVYYSLLLGIPIGFGWMAYRYGCAIGTARWTALGLVLHGFFHQLSYHASAPGHKGYLVWTYAYHWDPWAFLFPLLGFTLVWLAIRGAEFKPWAEANGH